MKKPIGGGSIISAYIIDPIVKKLGNLFIKLPFTPNQITIISALVGISAGVLFILDYWILGALLIFITMVLDGLDGEIARRKKMKSNYGCFLDSLLDRFVDISIIFGIAYSSTKFYSDIALIIGFFSATFAGILSSYSSYLIKIVGNIEPCWENEKPKFSDNRDVRLFILILGALGNVFVNWSALTSVLIVFILSFVKVISRLFFYRNKLER